MVGRCTSLLTGVIGQRVHSAAVITENGEEMDAAKRGGAMEQRHICYLDEGLYGAFSSAVVEHDTQNGARNWVASPQVICHAKRREGRDPVGQQRCSTLRPLEAPASSGSE